MHLTCRAMQWPYAKLAKEDASEGELLLGGLCKIYLSFSALILLAEAIGRCNTMKHVSIHQTRKFEQNFESVAKDAKALLTTRHFYLS